MILQVATSLKAQQGSQQKKRLIGKPVFIKYLIVYNFFVPSQKFFSYFFVPLNMWVEIFTIFFEALLRFLFALLKCH